MKVNYHRLMLVYAAIALILIWSGAGWILTEFSKLGVPDTAPISERFNQFIMLHGISMVLIGTYIMLKNIIFRDTIIY